MRTFLIGYDLNKPRENNDYKDLIAKIKSLSGTYWHKLDSTWIIKTDLSSKQIRDLLKPFLDKGDELLVARLQGTASWANFDAPASDWLVKYLSYE